MTLEQLLLHIMDKFGFPLHEKRRLRKLQQNELFFLSEMEKTLDQLGFEEG